MVERRSIKRQAAALYGRLAYGPELELAECVVRDVTTTGAMLIVRPNTKTPETFDLLIGTGGPMRPCRLVWRQGLNAGVRFT